MTVQALAMGQRTRMIRRRRGLSVDVVAGLAGISKSYLSALKRGSAGSIGGGLVGDLAAALGCSVADLTGQPYLPADRATVDALATVSGIELAVTRRGYDAADQLGEPGLAAFASMQHAGNLIRLGARHRAATVLGDALAAVEPAAADVPRLTSTLASANQRSALHFDIARGWAQARGDRDAEAIRYLDAADRIAQTRIRNDPIALDRVLTLD